MHIDIAAASPNGAPATEPACASSEAPAKGKGCSFADLLNAAADETDAEPADECDDEPACDGWQTAPVFVPFVPIIPPEDVITCEESGGTSIEETCVKTASFEASCRVPEEAMPDVAPSVKDEKGTAAGTKTQGEAKAADLSEAASTVESNPDQIAGATPAEAIESKTGIDPIVPPVAKGTQGAAGKPGKAAKSGSTPKVPDVTEVTKPSAADAVANVAAQNTAAVQKAQSEAVSSGESKATDAPSETTSNPKGAAARLLRALERAAESSAAQRAAAATGENGQSTDTGTGEKSSLGEWIKEQLPQVVAGRAQSITAPTFSLVAPPQDARAAGVLASGGGNLTPTAPAVTEHDVTLQIVQSMRLQFRDGIGEAVLKLNPEHLGSVSISLRIENGGLKASVQAEVPAVRQWLESQLETLRNGLADHGLRLDRFDVDPDGQREASHGNAPEERARKRQARKPLQSEQPVFEIVV